MGLAKRIDCVDGYINGYRLTVMDCPSCGEVFAMLSEFVSVRRRDCNTMYCPNGHTMAYTLGKSREQVLQEELDRARADAERHRQARIDAEKRTIAQRGVVTRMKRRVEAGVCPHCTRTFKQLAAHMKSKHSDICKAGA